MLQHHFKTQRDRHDFAIAVVVVALAALLVLGLLPDTADRALSIVDQLSIAPKGYDDRSPLITNDGVTYTYQAMEIKERYVPPVAKIRTIEQRISRHSYSHRTEAAAASTPKHGSPQEVSSRPIAIAATTPDSSSTAEIALLPTEVTSTSLIDTAVQVSAADTTRKIPAATTTIDQGLGAIPNDCVIVIGSFANQKNINGLLQDLRVKGHRVFTAPHKGLTRIGLYSSCDNTILYTRLREIQRLYAKDAFVVKRNNKR